MDRNLPIAGWNETASLPEFGVEAIRVKLDTGAKTSTLHAFNIETFKKSGKTWLKFEIHPLQFNDNHIISCEAPLVDLRNIKSSNGQKEKRYIISSLIKIGDYAWPIEITLTNRDEMNYRMLLGRTAMQNKLIVDPHRTHLLSKRVRTKKRQK